MLRIVSKAVAPLLYIVEHCGNYFAVLGKTKVARSIGHSIITSVDWARKRFKLKRI